MARQVDHADHISTRQYARFVDVSAPGIGLRGGQRDALAAPNEGVHLYKQTGNVRSVRIPSGHTKIESTERYPRIDVDDPLALAEGAKVWRSVELPHRSFKEFRLQAISRLALAAV